MTTPYLKPEATTRQDIEPSQLAADAFGRMRVSEPKTVFDSHLMELDSALFWQNVTASGGTATRLPNESTMSLVVNTTNGSSVIRQTKQYFPYQPGKGLGVVMTVVPGAVKANVTKRWGFFDASNGIFFEQTSAGLFVVLRSFVTGSVVDTRVPQASWNLDPLDGTGASKETLDPTKVQICELDMQWLGAGRVRLAFNIGGISHPIHQFEAANVISTVYMTRATLPVRYEIVNTGATGSSTELKTICCSVISSGGYDPLGVVRSVDTGAATKSVTNTLVPLVSIRLKAANVRATLVPEDLSVWVTNAADLRWQLILNPTLTGPSWTSVGANSVAEYDITASALTGGEIIESGYAGNRISPPVSFKESFLRVVADYAGTADILTLAAVRIDAGNANALASLTFKEVF